MTRSRMVREGTVGLFILGGIVTFIGLGLWVSNAVFGRDTYSFTVVFQDASGIQAGGGVRYRGLRVGQITSLEGGIDGVEAKVQINDADLRIPAQSRIAANQAGLIAETVIDITPIQNVSAISDIASPVRDDCDSQVIICDGDVVRGDMGITFNQLIESTLTLADVYGDPAFVESLKLTLDQTGIAAQEFAQLSRDLSTLSRRLDTEAQGFSQVTEAVTDTSAEISQATNRLTRTAETTANQITQLSTSAENTTRDFSQLANNLNTLVVENRSTLVGTLDNLNTTSGQLSEIITLVTPTLQEVNTTFTALDTQELVRNLETLTANAAEASANLRDVSITLNDPTNLVLLQQTLDSARVTFANTQKITSDLDELTGDPAFRQNLLRLVNGLSGLVSSTESLEQQVHNARVLEPMNEMIKDPNTTFSFSDQPLVLKPKSRLKVPEGRRE